MALLRRLLSAILEKSTEKPPSKLPELKSIPTVKFNRDLVTEDVQSALRDKMKEIPEFTSIPHFEGLYATILSSIQRGGDLYTACNAMKDLGVPKKRAEQIGRYLQFNAKALIDREQEKSLGIKYAIWIHSAPCMLDPKRPTEEDLRRDAAHRNANGKRYKVEKGLYIDGKWMWPGQEWGCKCSSRAVLPW